MTAPEPSGDPRVPSARARGVAAGVLVVVASLLLPVGLVTVWLRDQILDTEAFVAAAGEVAERPAVQRDVTDQVVAALSAQLGVGGNAAAGASIRRATAEVVSSPRFEQLWEVSVRRAHRNALRLAKGEPTPGVETGNGRVAVNLDPVVDAVVARLPGPIAALIPPVTTGDDIVLFRTSELASAEPFVRAVDGGWWAVPVVSAALFVAAIAIASRRRRTVLGVGIGLLAASIATFVGLLVTRDRLLDATDTRVGRSAASAVFDVVIDLLRTELWVTAAMGVGLVAATVVLGLLRHPHPAAAVSSPPISGPSTSGSSVITDPPLRHVEPTPATPATPAPEPAAPEPAGPKASDPVANPPRPRVRGVQ